MRAAWSAGGTPTPVTVLDATRGETNHLWPHVLPDGHHYLFVVGARDNRGVYVGVLDSPERTLLLGLQELGDGNTRVEYAARYLLRVRNRALLAQPFDPDRLSLTGSVTQVAENVLMEGPGASAFSTSDTGVLAFWGGAVPPDSQLTWLTRDGAVAGKVGPLGRYFSLAFAPDSRTVAVSRFDPNEISVPIAVWLVDAQRSTSTKFTSGIGSSNPIWSPDGARVGFSSPKAGPPSLFQKSFRDGGPDELLFKAPSPRN